MTEKRVKECRVEVVCEKNRFAMFDFGDFGIVIEYDDCENKDTLNVCFNDNYHKKFMDVWFKRVKDTTDGTNIKEAKLKTRAFEEIERVFLGWQRVPYSKLWSLLKKNFPEHINFYGR